MTENQNSRYDGDSGKKHCNTSWPFHILLPIRKKFIAYRKKYDDREYRKECRERLTILLLIATAIGVFMQWRELNKTDESIRIQTRIAARPWAGLSDDLPGLTVSKLRFNASGDAEVEYFATSKNYGTTGAQNVAFRAQLLLSPKAGEIDRTKTDVCERLRGASSRGFGFVLFPGKSRITEGQRSTFPKAKMIHPNYDGRFNAWLIGCLAYRDQFNFQYFTKFTYWLVDDTNQAVSFQSGENVVIDGVFAEQGTSLE